jgi:hypothetical protein
MDQGRNQALLSKENKMLAFNVLSRLSSAAEWPQLARLINTEYALIIRYYDGGRYGSGLAFGVGLGEGKIPQSRLRPVLSF